MIWGNVLSKLKLTILAWSNKNSIIIRIITSILCSQIISSALCAQAWVQNSLDIYGSDVNAGQVGARVQLSEEGNYLLSTSDLYYGRGGRIYKLNDSQWELEYTTSGTSYSMSSDATTLVAGNKNVRSGSVRAGRISVISGDVPSTWSEKAEVVGSYNDSQYIYLGEPVEISANGNIVVGVSFNYGAFVYSFDGNSLNQLGSVINGETFPVTINNVVTPSGNYVQNRIADLSLSSDGQFIAISATLWEGFPGEAYGKYLPYIRIFKLGSSDWEQVGETLGDFAGVQGFFDNGTYEGDAGISLNHDGTILVVGLPYISSDGIYRTTQSSSEASDKAGMVRTYRLIDGNWQQTGHDLLGSPGEYFGSSVSLSADGMRLAVGNTRWSSSSSNEPSVSTYQWTTQGWVRFGEEIIHDGSYVSSVAFSPNGQVLAIGDVRYSTDLGRVGVVRTYTYAEDIVNVNFEFGNVLAFKSGGGALNQSIARGGDVLAPNFETLFGYNFLGWSEALEAIGSDINITPILESTNVGLDSFYESDTGVPVTVSVLPDDLTSYTYQWYHNGFAIPPAYGGADSSYTIPGSLNSDGIWSVEVSYLNHTETANFEYRVFVDADTDGYSDYRESNILGTNPNNADTDGDGLSDYDELETHGTQPTLTDSNGDGFGDGVIFNAGLSLSSDYSALSQDLLSRQKDLRIGSKISSVANDIATLQVVLEESEDLDSWTERQTIDLNVPLQDGETTKFFRYKMAD